MNSDSVIFLDNYRKAPTLYASERRSIDRPSCAELRTARRLRSLLAAAELAVTALIGVGFTFCVCLVIAML